MMRHRSEMWISFAAMLISGVASAATIYVAPDGDDANPGTAERPKRCIQAILNAWKGGDTLVLKSGTYHLQTIKADGENGALHLCGSGTIRGETGDPEDVVVDGDATTECIRLAGTMEVHDITFQNGLRSNTASAFGANMSLQSEYVVASNCIVRSSASLNEPCAGTSMQGARFLDCRFLSITGNCAGAVLRLAGSNTVARCVFGGCVVTNGQSTSLGGVQTGVGSTFDGCRFENGTGLMLSANGHGGAPTRITRCSFVGNWSGLGGACRAGDFTVFSDCSFRSNHTVTSGGALYAAGGAFVTNCVFEGNVSGYAGGALASGASKGRPTYVVDSTFASNVATNCGGAVSVGYRLNLGGGSAYAGHVRLERCVISNNLARATAADGAYHGGGGVFVFAKADGVSGSGGEIRDCVILGNRALNCGGGIGVRNWDATAGFANSDPLSVRNCLIARNASGGEGGGLYMIHNGADGGYTVDSCTVVSNRSDKGAAGGPGLYHKLQGVACTNTLFAANTLITNLPQNYDHCCFDPRQAAACAVTASPASLAAAIAFRDAGRDDFRLAAMQSPCRDAGVFEDWMAAAADLSGGARVFGARPDIGCYELSWPRGCQLLIR